MTIQVYGVSAFTAQFFRGNPAAVCLLDTDERRENPWYQRVAAITCQPATAFCQPRVGGFDLRWFSPTQELVLCGHGTLATAHILYETGAVAAQDEAVLSTMSGDLRVRHDGDLAWISLPAVQVAGEQVSDEVLRALGLPGAVRFARAAEDLLVELASADEVEKVQPDFGLLSALATTRTIVTAAGGDDVDFTSRVFPPRIGVNEDQVTGAAHAALGPYWALRLGRDRLRAQQASVRGGRLALDLTVPGVVQIGGQAVTTSHGELLL